MKKTRLEFFLRVFCFCFCFFFMVSCRSESSESSKKPAKTENLAVDKVATYEEISPIVSMSCMPCHNRHTIGTVIQRLEKSDLSSLDGETRARVLAEIGELRQYMEEGVPVSFTSEVEIQKFLKAAPGEFYTMLQKGVMPPSWAPELMEHIGFDDYKPLSWDNRILLLRYAKPYSKAYLR